MAEPNAPIQPSAPYSPLGESVIQRDYTQANASVSPEQAQQRIPEPVYSQQNTKPRVNPYDLIQNGGEMPTTSGGSGSKSSEPTVNPAMNQLGEKEKTMGAEQLAKIIMDVYEQAHDFGNKALQVSDNTLRKLSIDGSIDLSIPIPFEGGYITIGEAIANYNKQNEDTLTVTKEFKKDVMPPLTRVLSKHGAGLTDEQYLMVAFGKDIAIKLVIVTQMRSTMTQLIESLKETTLATRNGATFQNMPHQRPPQAPAPPQQDFRPPPPPQAPVDETDYNFTHNEAFASTVVRMEVPTTGKDRLMEQREKEATWKKNDESANGGTKLSYAEIQAQRKNKNGKRGRNTTPSDYLTPMDEEQIAEAIILRESKETDKDAEFLDEVVKDPLE